MTQAEFARRVVAMQDTLYRVSTTLLPQLCGRVGPLADPHPD